MNWIIFTFFGAFFQNLRSSLQKKLNKDLSLIASSYVRFVFALPFATILFFSYFQNFSIISVILSNSNFIIYTFFASVLQIMFTFSLLYLFRFSNFVVGTSLSKTEVIQVAIFEYIVLSDKLNAAGVIGIIIATTGVIIMTIKDVNFFIKNLFSKTTLIGLITGLFLGLITLMDEGLELALGFHAANNLVTALLVTASWTAFQTESLLIDNSEPILGVELILTLLLIYPLIVFIFAKKYKWKNWLSQLTNKF